LDQDLDTINAAKMQSNRPRLETSISPSRTELPSEEKNTCIDSEEDNDCLTSEAKGSSLACPNHDIFALESKDLGTGHWTEASALNTPSYHFIAPPLKLTPQNGDGDNDTLKYATKPAYDMFAANFLSFVNEKHMVISEAENFPSRPQQNSTEDSGHADIRKYLPNSLVNHESDASSPVTGKSASTLCASYAVPPKEDIVLYVL
jgi:hypothetical protein